MRRLYWDRVFGVDEESRLYLSTDATASNIIVYVFWSSAVGLHVFPGNVVRSWIDQFLSRLVRAFLHTYPNIIAYFHKEMHGGHLISWIGSPEVCSKGIGQLG